MRSKLMTGICAFALFACVVIVGIYAAPGDSEDPVVTLGFVEERLAQMKTYVDDEINKLDPNMERTLTTFKVVEVPKGKKLVAGEGTEMILRQGTATIFATKKGGVSNTTAGYDLADGVNAPANSLLIVPLADGRGLTAETDLLVMVKGTYTLN